MGLLNFCMTPLHVPYLVGRGITSSGLVTRFNTAVISRLNHGNKTSVNNIHSNKLFPYLEYILSDVDVLNYKNMKFCFVKFMKLYFRHSMIVLEIISSSELNIF